MIFTEQSKTRNKNVRLSSQQELKCFSLFQNVDHFQFFLSVYVCGAFNDQSRINIKYTHKITIIVKRVCHNMKQKKKLEI